MVIIKPLIQTKVAEAALTTQYIAPVASKAVIDKFTATNITTNPRVITVHIVPSGGTASTGNEIVTSYTIGAYEAVTLTALIGHVLAPGDFIATNSLEGFIVIRASGREII